jgi:hypothetical protein
VRKPTNKALAVLALLREMGESSVNAVANEMRKRTPCGACGGTGEGDDWRYGCRRCYGRGQVPFGYSDAYQALKQLRVHGLVERRRPLNEFGDELASFVWWAVDVAATDDLEALFLAPSAVRP